MESLVIINAIFNEKINQFDITTNVTDAVFTSTDIYQILPFVEVAVKVEDKVKLAANYSTMFRVNGSIDYIGRPEDMRDFDVVAEEDKSPITSWLEKLNSIDVF